MSDLSDQNKQITLNFFDQVFNQGNMDFIATAIDPSYTFTRDGKVLIGGGDPVASTAGWAQGLRNAVANLNCVIDSILAEDDKVALRWRMNANDKTSGASIMAIGTNIITFVGGKAVANDQSGGENFEPAS
ncbi:MAG: ester cyclase [Caulobacteraceae bacterium]|nr:ester cyclase [Caulobacteraceae bacterium]